MSRSQMVAILLMGVAFLVIPLPAFSQSCSLCYTQAASATAKLIQALRSGILVLIIPPMLISAGITFLAYSKRNKFRRFDDVRGSDEGTSTIDWKDI